MNHFVCTGKCHGVSEKAGVCETADCTKKGADLTECNCSDGNHAAVLASEEAQSGE